MLSNRFAVVSSCSWVAEGCTYFEFVSVISGSSSLCFNFCSMPKYHFARGNLQTFKIRCLILWVLTRVHSRAWSESSASFHFEYWWTLRARVPEELWRGLGAALSCSLRWSAVALAFSNSDFVKRALFREGFESSQSDDLLYWHRTLPISRRTNSCCSIGSLLLPSSVPVRFPYCPWSSTRTVTSYAFRHSGHTCPSN